MNTPMALRMPHILSGPEALSTHDIKDQTFRLNNDKHFEYFPNVADPANPGEGPCTCEECVAANEPTTPFALPTYTSQAEHRAISSTPFSLDILLRPGAQPLSRDATLLQLSKAVKKLSEQPKPAFSKLKSRWQCGSATFDKVVLSIEPNPSARARSASPEETAGEPPMLEWKDVAPILGDRGLAGYFRDPGKAQLLEIQFAVMKENVAQPIAFGKVKRGKFRGGSGDYAGVVERGPVEGIGAEGVAWAALNERVGRDFR